MVGVTLQLYPDTVQKKKGACCAGQDIYDAKRVAEAIGIPHYVLDYESRFRKHVIEDFANAYNFARNTWCDMVIDPLETRNVMALLLDLAGRLPLQHTDFGVLRM